MSTPIQQFEDRVVKERSPLQPLRQLASNQASGQLKVTAGGVEWYIDLALGRIVYGTHSVDPLERLLNALRRVNGGSPALSDDVTQQVKALFDPATSAEMSRREDYDALLWLLDQGKVGADQAARLTEVLIVDALESLLCVSEATCSFTRQTFPDSSTMRSFDLMYLLEQTQQRLRSWQGFGGQIGSPYQRLYFIGQTTPEQQRLPEMHRKLRDRLRGITLRQLAIELGRDELDLARTFAPYIKTKVVYLRDPQPPHHLLPKLVMPGADTTAPQLRPTAVSKPAATHTIACVDDSPTVTNEIRRFLEDANYTVVAINDPLKALMQIVRLKPDMILLDVGMPLLDGYELCRLLRRTAAFKKSPIIMVTGNTGFLDRAKAAMVGATDYLTKPFNQEDLCKMVARHLPGEGHLRSGIKSESGITST